MTSFFQPAHSFAASAFAMLFVACSSASAPKEPAAKSLPTPTSSVVVTSPSAPKVRACTFDKVRAHELKPSMNADDVQACKSECSDGEQAACVALAVFHMEGNLLPKDFATASELFAAACKANFAPGCARLGIQLALGLGLEEDAKAAVQLLKSSCESSDPDADACYMLADMIQHGKGTTQSEALATQFYEKACKLGQADACMRFGDMIPDRDATRKTGYYAKACELGSVGGCASLGAAYFSGNGVAEDKAKAFEYSMKACDGGNVAACTNLGLLLVDGATGVPKDESRAAALFEKACDNDFATACSNFGVLMQQGRGIGKDETRALKYFAKGCDGDFAPACFKLGFAIEEGRGIPKNLPGALKAYQIGCEKGDEDCCHGARRLSRANPGGRR